MSGIGWQDIVVALIALCAVGYLVRRKLGARRNALPCGDCPGCATSPAAPAGNELVSIGVATDALARPRAPG